MEKIILDKTVTIRIWTQNHNYYKKLGFDVKRGDYITIPVNLLYPYSIEKIRVQCSYCKKVRYARYAKIYKNNNTTCNGCLRRDFSKINKKYGKLTFLKFLENRKGLFRCECGKIKEIAVRSVFGGYTISCGCYFESLVGEKHHLWDRNITYEERKSNRKSALNKRFVRSVIRNNRKCVICGSDKNIEVHHLNSYKNYHNSRFDFKNVVVLCNKHHKEFHKWHGWRKSKECTKEDFIQWLENSRGAFRVNGKLFDELINEIKRDG